MRIVRAGALVYTAAFGIGTVLSIRHSYPAEPLGIRTGLSPGWDALAGNGAALAAPWPMIALLWWSLARGGEDQRRGRRWRAGTAFLSATFLAGSVAEPISHRLMKGELPLLASVVASVNLVLPVLMLGGSVASLVTAGGEAPV